MLGEDILFDISRVSIDDKKRVVISASYKPDDNEEVYIVFCEDHIDVYGKEKYKEILKTKAPGIERDLFTWSSSKKTVDKQKRLTIGTKISDILGFQEKVVVAGSYDHLSIYNCNTFEEKLNNSKLKEYVKKIG